MLYTDQYNPFESSLTNARNVVSLEWLYEGLKQSFGKFFLVLLSLLVGLPVVILFGYWLQRKRKSFRKHMRKELPVFTDSKQYFQFKEKLAQLNQFKPILKKVTGYNMKRAPWPLSYTLSQMQKMSSTLLTYSNWLNNRLDDLNTEQFSGQSKNFTFLSEKELWKKRNKAYQYWM